MSSYNKTYSPCDDCQYLYSKNGQEMSTCNICEYKHLQDSWYSWKNRTDKVIEELEEDSQMALYEMDEPGIYAGLQVAIDVIKKGDVK